MNDAPKRIWAYEFEGGDTIWHKKDFPESGSTEYIRADLLPCWRPIAELPDEWRDGRQVFMKNGRGYVWVLEYQIINGSHWGWYNNIDWFADNEFAEFLDFGGHSMPAYDGA